MDISNENQSETDRKPIENKKKSYQALKYDATVRPFKNLPTNRNLLDLAYSLKNPAEFQCIVRLWDWFQSTEIKDHDFKFMLSRSKLAEITGLSEKVTQRALATLKRHKALIAVETRFGVNTYVWSTHFLYRGVSLKDTAPVSKRYGPCIQKIRPLYPKDTASIICTLILPFYIPSYTTFSGHKPIVDNSIPDLRSFIGEVKDALRAGFPKETLKDALRAGLPIRKVIGLADAILDAWIGSDRDGGSYFLHDILLVLRTWQVNLWESENITAVLYHVLKDGENLHKARKKIKNFYNSEKELFDHHFEMLEASEGGSHE